jgi:hypothetical protein
MNLKRLVPRAASMLLLAFPVALLASGVANADLTNSGGTVTLQGPGGTAGTPYSSGQTITVNLEANSAFSAASGAAGPYIVEECQAPNGVLPTTPTDNCDHNTVGAEIVSTNSDGSLADYSYTVYALPDIPIFSETAGPGQPNCGTAPNYCVLYIGSPFGGATSFPTAHLFSAPFQISANSDDGGENPGDGTPESPLPILMPLLGVAVLGGGFTIFARRRRHAA